MCFPFFPKKKRLLDYSGLDEKLTWLIEVAKPAPKNSPRVGSLSQLNTIVYCSYRIRRTYLRAILWKTITCLGPSPTHDIPDFSFLVLWGSICAITSTLRLNRFVQVFRSLSYFIQAAFSSQCLLWIYFPFSLGVGSAGPL